MANGQEKYQPSKEEVGRAESIMTERQRQFSEIRDAEQYIAKWHFGKNPQEINDDEKGFFEEDVKEKLAARYLIPEVYFTAGPTEEGMHAFFGGKWYPDIEDIPVDQFGKAPYVWVCGGAGSQTYRVENGKLYFVDFSDDTEDEWVEWAGRHFKEILRDIDTKPGENYIEKIKNYTKDNSTTEESPMG